MTSAFFIIDCGLTSGLGHVRRSLVLADAMRKIDVKCQFHITSDIGLPMLQSHNFNDIVHYDNIPSDTDVLIIDGNIFTNEQLAQWGKSPFMICIIDDNGKRPVEADVLINPNLYAKSVCYDEYSIQNLLMGPHHHLIAPEFFESDLERNIDFLISFGGTDDGRLAGPLIKRLQAITGKSIAWAVPQHISPQADIVALAENSNNFSLVTDGNIPELLARSHCFIGGAGAMVSEALASGCCVVTCAIVPDQAKNVEFLTGYNLPVFPQFDVENILEAALSFDQYSKPDFNLDKNASQVIAEKIVSWTLG